MVDLFDKLYTSIVSRSKFLENIRYYSCLRFLVRCVANITLPIYFFMTRRKKKYSLQPNFKTDPLIIVSLTSYPVRINRLWLVIETILRQTKKPDKIVLWLSKNQVPDLKALPKNLLNQRYRGLEIMLVENDIRSHKKYFYTLQNFPKDNMITIDDDIFYRSKMIEEMVEYAKSYPASVISQYCKKITWADGQLQSFIFWHRIVDNSSPNLNFFFGSGGGTFFPSGSMDSSVLEEDLFMALTPSADDVWLNAMCKLKKTSVITTAYYSHNLPVINFSDVTLASVNNGLRQNDFQIEAIRKYFMQKRGVDPFFEFREI